MTSGMMSADSTIPREDPDLNADELTVLGQYLDFHRATLAMKCARLSESDLKRRAIPTSNVTLLGLVRHLTEVEKYWFHRALGQLPAAPTFWTAEHPDGDFDLVDPAQAAHDLADFRKIVRLSDEIAARYDLDDTFARPGHEGDYSVRYLYIHMIEEYARHNGHADLLRERIDGLTGE